MSNIIDSIRLSGTTYQIQGSGGGITVDPTLDSGSTNPVANSAITTALGNKVNVVDNNVSAYTFVNKISGVEYGYSEHFAGPIYIRYTGSTSSSGSYYAGSITYYTNEWGWESIGLSFNLSDGQITATTVSSNYFDIEIENGEAALTFKDGYYLRQYESRNEFVALTKTTYESGQSADVIEDTVYDVFDKLNDKIDKAGDNAVTGSSMTFSDGYLNSSLYTKKTSLSSTVKIDSSTIKSSDNGLSVQFETPEVADKILNVGSGTYGQLFSTSSYDTSINEFTITFNPNCTQYNVYNFSVRIIEASNISRSVIIEYDSADMSAVYTGLSAYCTVTDTLSTDYKLKVTAKEGYKIARLNNSNYMVGGVDNTNPNNYISNLVTTPSYVQDGQDVIDDIYDKLDDKQDTLQSGTNIKTINNQSILGSGNIDIQGGGKAIEAGRGISITTGETADTVSFDLPISAGTGTGALIIASDTYNLNNKASGAYAVSLNGGAFHPNYATGNSSLAEGNDTRAVGECCHAEGHGTSAGTNTFPFTSNAHAEGDTTYAKGGSSHAEGSYTSAMTYYSHTEGYYTIANNYAEHASGKYNVSNTGSTDADKTLFSVGNGTGNNARHNAFEIRQDGSIFITSGGTDIKLQDHLGGGGSSYTAGDGIDITNDVISVTGKVDTTAFTAHTADTTVHVTSTEKSTWNAKSDFSGDYNDLDNKPTIPTVPTSNTAFTNDAGYITSSALDDYATTGDVQTATNDMATKTWVGNQGYLTEHQSLSNYYTKSETSGATEISTALGNKQDTLVSGTNIKTINGETLLGEGNITIEGGGKAVSGGTNISITTGETADTINCTLPIYISSNVDKGDINIGTNNNANSAYYNIAIGRKIDMSNTQGGSSIVIATPTNNTAFYNKCYGGSNVGIGKYIQIGESNSYSGARHNCVVIGNEAKSLINQGVAIGYHTVASGTTKTNINNQLTIDTSNQVYIYNKDNTEMICLQDQLGGGGSSYSAGTGIDITNNVISVSGVVETSAITTSVTSSSTDSQVPSAKAVYDQLGGLKLVKLSQTEYDSLSTKDNSTLYVIVN